MSFVIQTQQMIYFTFLNYRETQKLKCMLTYRDKILQVLWCFINFLYFPCVDRCEKMNLYIQCLLSLQCNNLYIIWWRVSFVLFTILSDIATLVFIIFIGLRIIFCKSMIKAVSVYSFIIHISNIWVGINWKYYRINLSLKWHFSNLYNLILLSLKTFYMHDNEFSKSILLFYDQNKFSLQFSYVK